MVKGSGNGWLRRKKGATLFCCRDVEGMERSFVIGSAATDEKSAWAKGGELGLQKRVPNTDPSSVTFGELAEKYQANPAIVQAIMGHSRMDMTLCYAHSSTKQKRAALDHYAEQIVSSNIAPPLRVPASA